MDERIVKHYARLFGLPPERIRFFADLTDDQASEVAWLFSLTGAGKYVYALKSTGRLVDSRYKRDFLIERTNNNE